MLAMLLATDALIANELRTTLLVISEDGGEIERSANNNLLRGSAGDVQESITRVLAC